MKRALQYGWIGLHLLVDILWVGMLYRHYAGYWSGSPWLFWVSILLIWQMLHFLAGTYTDVTRKSRFKEIGSWVVTWLLGMAATYAWLRWHTWIPPLSFIQLGVYYLVADLVLKAGYLTLVRRLEKKGILRHPSLIVGSDQHALKILKGLQKWPLWQAYAPVGFVSVDGNNDAVLAEQLPYLGSWKDLPDLIKKHQIEELIIGVDPRQYKVINEIIRLAIPHKVIIKIAPDDYDVLAGSVRLHNIFSEPLIEIFPEVLPFWQRVVKRTLDIVASAIGLVVLSPLMAFLAYKVRRSSPGPIIYKQIRLGKYGRPFYLYKFRSMYVDAEKDGPRLATENDPRITPWGRVMRKWRLDELPQLWNVLKGDMSLVGPRPERPYFVEKILARAPHYMLLFTIKPGLTSLGVIRFGYASTIDELIQRMRYDLIYLENMSIWLDFKIILYTLYILLKGHGK